MPGIADDVRVVGETTNLIVTVTGGFSVRTLDTTSTLRILSDLTVNSALTVAETLINRGVLRLESERPDRTSTLVINGAGGLDNRGLLWVVAQNQGGRRLNGAVSNRGRILVENGIAIGIGNRDRIFSSLDGRIDATGTLSIEEGRVTVTGGAISGDVRIFGGTVDVAASVTTPATLRLLGAASRLVANASPAMTLWLDTDIGNNTTLTSVSGAVNEGRIVLGSSRSDRGTRFELGAGFTNRPNGLIEVLRVEGGDRALNGRLINQGLVRSTNTTLLVTGTYQADGGRVVGDVRFLNARILPTRATPEPTALQLFGASFIDNEIPTNLVLRVISDLAAHAALTFNTNLVNAGVITLESLRPDRTTALQLGSRTLENRGLIRVVSTNGGERQLVGRLTNQGRIEVEAGIHLQVVNGNAVLNQQSGRVDVAGSLGIEGGSVNVLGGVLTGTIRLINTTTLVASTVTEDLTLRLLGTASVLAGNLSPKSTLVLDTDLANPTTVTTTAGAVNEGRIVLSSSRGDRACGLEVGAGFTNRPNAEIEAVAGQGGARGVNGFLINQGRLSATGIPLLVTGTYQADGGVATGEVNFLNARIAATKSTPQPTELRLFGAGSELTTDNLENLVLRVISDLAANARLMFNTNLINRGVVRLESLRPDRTTVLRTSGGPLVNGPTGVIVSTAENGGGRSLDAAVRNQGLVHLDYALGFATQGAQHVNSGRIELNGQSLNVVGSSLLNAEGGQVVGSGTFTMNGGTFSNAGLLSPGASPGRIAINGNFTQVETGVLRVEIAGATGIGTGHDALEITAGTARLNGGALQTRLLGDYVPAADVRFRVLTATGGVSGRFARTPSLQIHPNRYLQTEYLPNALDLRTLVGVNTTLPPSIALHPVSQTVAEQSAVQFIVAVNGQGPFTYQWRFNGQPIAGATGSSLSLPRVAAANFGNYDVIVSNAAGSTTSDPASLAKQSGPTGGTAKLDYGDAPDQPYLTTVAHGGASQRVLAGFSLGALIDGDDGTLQNATATADGTDEDGVQFLDPLVRGQVVRIRVLHSHPPGQLNGRLSAWIDWNNNGSWSDAGERIITDQTPLNAVNTFNVPVPANAVIGTTFARFRLYTDIYPGPDGPSDEEGEVEDYQVTITGNGEGGGGGGGQTGATQDFGDAPDSYQTLLASDGPRHVYSQDLYLGSGVDLETNGIPHLLALGDDLNGVADDEDGVTGSPFLVTGTTAKFTVTVVGNGKVDAWFDFNRDGDFADANERVLTGEAFSTESRQFSILVPATAVPGGSFARFRLTRQGVNAWFGAAQNGEVEDYAVLIVAAKKDWGDAPENYPTTSSSNGARHTVVDDFHLGKSIDGENDGQPNGNATGDDLVPLGAADDEDGVNFVTPLFPGQSASVEVEASQAGRLDAWIDFGNDGDWIEGPDRIFTALPLQAGVNNLTFNVPANAAAGPTFARFRLSRNGLNTYTGDGGEGEVEDYRVVIERNAGCELGCTGSDFWLTFPGNLAPDPANPVEPRLRFTGPNGTTLTIAIPGLGTTLVTNIVAGGMTVLLPATVDLGGLNDAVLNRGIHVTSSAPVGLYAISQVDFTSDGFHALPTEVLTGEYVISAYPNTQVGVPEISGSQFAVVATRPLTRVAITPSYETGLRLASTPYSITLTNVGDVYQLRNTNDAPADLTGTIIEADQPVAVFGGHVCGNVNSSQVFYCDYLVEQLLPTERLATEYFTAPLATRSGGETVRIVAARRATDFTINGVALTLTNRGDVFETVLSGASRIVANKPVHVSQFASSSDFDDVANADPFMVTVPGRSHFTSSHTFATAGDVFATHHVTVVVPSSVTSMTLDGVATSPSFTTIPTSSFKYAHLNVTQGIHTLSASADFGAIVYGWNLYESYAWPSCLFFGDTTPPNLTCATNRVTVPIAGPGTDVPCKGRVPDLRSLVTARDNCGIANSPVITQEPAPGTLASVGTNVVTLSTTDNRGNIGTCTVDLVVVDPNPSQQVTLTCPPDLSVRCDDDEGATVHYTVEALIGCTPIAVTCTPPSGSRFPIGTTTVTCRITEPGVPVQECTFKVTVDCNAKRVVQIKPPFRPAPTPDNPNPPAEIEVAWDPEASVVLEAANDMSGPWVAVPTTAQGRHVIKILKERGKFFRLRAGP